MRFPALLQFVGLMSQMAVLFHLAINQERCVHKCDIILQIQIV